MTLDIFTPEQTVFNGKAESVMVPGKNDKPFVILDSHAPIISVLEKGTVKYVVNGCDFELNISRGFVEVRKNIVTVCAEL